MNYSEVKADLFSYYDKGYYLVHCISADFKLGAGIAKEFEKRFNLRDDLLFALGDKWYLDYDERFPGDALIHRRKRIIDLVTKTRYWHKPTMYSMRRSLEKMKRGGETENITKIAMPKIGCGLDKLKWEDVSSAIKEIFVEGIKPYGKYQDDIFIIDNQKDFLNECLNDFRKKCHEDKLFPNDKKIADTSSQ